MSYYDYCKGREIAAQDHPFYALLQAAMRQADPANLTLLRGAFPEVEWELWARAHTADGRLPVEEAPDVH